MTFIAWAPGTWAPDAWADGTWEAIVEQPAVARRSGGGIRPVKLVRDRKKKRKQDEEDLSDVIGNPQTDAAALVIDTPIRPGDISPAIVKELDRIRAEVATSRVLVDAMAAEREAAEKRRAEEAARLARLIAADEEWLLLL
jgi:hypothetical protein